MIEEIDDKNRISMETIYGWFPSNEERSNRDPKDVYINLGVRHPKKESFNETAKLNKYHQENKNNLIKNTQTVEEALRPPWSLNVGSAPNKPNENNLPQKTSVLNRSKSAPLSKSWKQEKAKYEIPKPRLFNLFNKEAKKYLESSNNNQKPDENKTINENKFDYLQQQISNKKSNEQMNMAQLELHDIIPIMIEAENTGKKPIINRSENLEAKSDQRKKNSKRAKTAIASRKEDNFPSELQTKSKMILTTSSNKVEHLSKSKHSEILNPNIEFLTADNFAKIIRKSSAQSRPPSQIGANQLLLTENWRTNLLERGKYLNNRPNYYVKIDIDKLRPEREAPIIHYNAAETFFYNTMPFRKATFDINPNFISENLNIQKLDLKLRGSSAEPVKYRRNFAFVY